MPELITPKQKISCGLCRACCSYLFIPAGEEPEENRKIKTWISSGREEKPSGEPCPQLNPNKMKFGCSIHSNPDKPSVCSTYVCGFALGFLGNVINHRPDNLGIIVDVYVGKIRITEIEKGALERRTTKRVMAELEMKAKTDPSGLDWEWEIIPLELMGSKLGVSVPIAKLSIGVKK